MFAALFVVDGLAQLDSLLVISKTIFNIITGLRWIGVGTALLLLGLVQALGLFAFGLAVMIAALAVASGMLRHSARVRPRLGGVSSLMGQVLNAIVGLLGFPHPLEPPTLPDPRGPVPLAGGRRSRPVVRMREAG